MGEGEGCGCVLWVVGEGECVCCGCVLWVMGEGVGEGEGEGVGDCQVNTGDEFYLMGDKKLV